jgi:drug/metabolite transporter (DMT)-like permease
VDFLTWPAVGALCALGSALTWAVTSLLVRTLIPPFNAVAINAIRSTVSGALLLGWILAARGVSELTAISAASLGLFAASIVAAIAIGDTVFFESTRRLGLARGTTISMTYPLFAAAFAAVFLGEPITARVAVGSLLTLVGLVLIVGARRAEGAGEEDRWLWVGGAALAALAWAASVILMKAPLREVDPITAQAVRLPIAGAVLFAVPWTRGAVRQLRTAAPALRWRMAGLSALTAVSSVMFAAGLKYADVAVATVLSSTVPMFAIPLGWLFLGERLSAGPILGALVTVTGIVVLQL